MCVVNGFKQSFTLNLLKWYFLGLVLLLLETQSQIASSALIMSMRNHQKKNQQNTRPMIQANQTSCSLFVGTWVKDDSYPLYQSSNCPIIEPQFDCYKYGRPDSDYLKYRWKPLNCELPRFNGAEFVSKMEGKTILFVGDSLGKNQWQSLICLILADLPSSASTQMSRGLPLSIFKFLDYGLTIEFYKAPYLVDIDVEQGKRVLKLQDMSGNGNAWRNADILVFNTGHWWSHLGSLQGWDYMESGGTYYQDMDRIVALEKAVRTWANWVDNNIETSRTRVFFQSISPTHYNPSEWGSMTTSNGNCYGETEPILMTTSGTMYTGSDQDQMRIENDIIKEMHTPVYLLDISMLSELRKDCHPSIYSGDLTPQQRAKPFQSADCSHWCLPGLPDTWNQLFYTTLFF